MRLDRLLVMPVLFLAGSALHAQDFNLDVGDNLILWPVPTVAYGAAAGQPGYWNDVNNPYSVTLRDLGGVLTGVTCASTITSSFNWPFGSLPADDSAFMNDIQAISSIGPAAVWTFNGLANGNYAIYTYAWAPDSANARTSVDVPGSSDGLQIVGGAWGGSPHVLGTTYALHHVAVTTGTLVVNCAGASGTSGSVNGFQIVLEVDTFSPFCAGDGSPAGVPCPCANLGALGHGCENSATTGGALLVASGTVGPDTVTMNSSGQLPTASAILLQGSTILVSPVTFGDGTRCIGGTLKRLYVAAAVGGAVSFPPPGGPTISARSATLGDPIASGSQRHYQVYYRDAHPSYCLPSPSSYNVSNAVTVNW